MWYVGVDLGGTTIKAAVVKEDGHILCSVMRPTGLPRPPHAVCDDLAGAVKEVVEKSGHPEKIAGLGIGCPGTVDPEAGVVRCAENLGWYNVALRREIEARTGFSPCLGNDANMAALGEARAGCGRGVQSLAMLTLGTGVGCGVVLENRLLTGFTGGASELGHMVIADGGALCSCGRRGCLEAYASGTALVRRMRETMRAHPRSILHEMARKEGTLSGGMAFQAAQAGDLAAQAVVAWYVHFLAVGVANVINIFFPEVVGLSGGVAQQGETLLVPLCAQVEPLVFGHRYTVRKTRIVAGELGYQAGMIGAAMLAAQEGAL